MSLNIDQIAETFCSHRFVETYPYMTDEIKWKVVGGEELIGKEAVIAKCEGSAKFLTTVSTTSFKAEHYPRGEPCSRGRRCTISGSEKSNLKRSQL
jgi:hypothetical protein